MSAVVCQSWSNVAPQVSYKLDPDNLKQTGGRDVAVLEIGNNVRVAVCRGVKFSWNYFLQNTPPVSIGGDGFVADCSRSSKDHWNFDHHGEEVDRAKEQSTCLQVFEGLQNGLGHSLIAAGARPTLFLNHICPDGIFAIHAISNREKYLSSDHARKPIGVLFDLEDKIDRGSHQIDLKDPALEILNWIVEPWWRDRARLERDSMTELSSTIEAVLYRLEQFEQGRACRNPVEVGYKLLRELDPQAPTPYGYTFLSEESPFTRAHLSQIGTRGGFVSILAQDGDKYWYRLGIFEPAETTQFPALKGLCAVLNCAEKLMGNSITDDSNQQNGGPGVYNRWGSSQIVGGGPPQGSLLAPATLTDIINNYILHHSRYENIGSGDSVRDEFISNQLPDLIGALVSRTALGSYI